MQKLTIDEIKQRSVLILKDIKRVCNELNLTYFLDSGTLLGAIRHNGFIPWDDDIDISMPRPDYEIFVKEYNKYCNSRYRLKSIEIDSRYGYPYAKVYDTTTILYEHGRNPFDLGLSIDIFSIDGYPDGEKEQIKHFNRVLNYFDLYASTESLAGRNYSLNPKHYMRNVRLFFSRFFLQRYKAKKVIKNARKFDFKNSEFAGINVCVYYHPNSRCLQKECWIPIEHQFEDDIYPIPKGYDSVLKSYYGDNYMTPPPENKRSSTHGLEIYTK